MTGAQTAKFDVAADGIVLSGTFDRTAASFAADVEAFSAQLAKLQKQRGFTDFLRAVKEDGPRVTIQIIPARSPRVAEDLAGLAGADVELVDGSAAAFDAAPRGVTGAAHRGPARASAPTPAPPADEKLSAELKKALFIPRR